MEVIGTRNIIDAIGTIMDRTNAHSPQGLNNLIAWHDHSLERFILVVQQNGGTLPRPWRRSHFQWFTGQEINAAEAMVREAIAAQSQ